MRLLVIGAGSIGRRHVRVFSQIQGISVALYDIDRARAERVSAEYGCLVLKELEHASAPEFNAAVIATPADSHLPGACRCAAAGMHILIEKPVAVSSDGVAQLGRYSESRGLVVAVGYVLRFHPAIVRTRELLAGNTLGRVLSVRAVCAEQISVARPHFRESYFASAAMGGGVVLDLSHEVNYLEWFFGGLQLEWCRTRAVPETGVSTECIADLMLTGEDSLPITVHLHESEWRRERICHIAGTEASLTADLVDGTVTLHAAGGDQRIVCAEQPDQWFHSQAIDFLEAIDGKHPPRCGAKEALATLEVCLEARQHARARASAAEE